MMADGGLETVLVFKEGIDLPLFAAFKALETEAGVAAITRYFDQMAQIAVETGRGFIMDTPTWRASSKWGAELGLSTTELKKIHREAIDSFVKLREKFETPQSPFVINGLVGPHGDGYAPETELSVKEAQNYYAEQVGWFNEMGADMVTGMTITSISEGIGIVKAAQAVSIPSVVSFTVETDGSLPSGEGLAEAIYAVDRATDGAAAYFMINCAHPEHFLDVIGGNGDWLERIWGLRANASRLSHAELDEAEELDDGDPLELGQLYRRVSDLLPNLTVVGGCCGTDHRHIKEICAALDAD
ncbi:homocysteine S-methyltransferase family protein [Sulfitobacter mediterraneus]|nr:homocysteine S-methyltransferase family protein [Sulfitobacter mediterraneus]MBM1635097.1 homocysteine S-methyltransferase family protein [Sulfitobacter mediterraneus]MBM1642921.1 homocysteine S-methyltransferase family protein [Sulfitobacter mediterraneus]MBM1646969.1 homocysteine S-methyltransferase family protein [Sulfitobacter mediterraneus]MBM1651011.1 homocysteine S-methyltransferase family protein [Sulfitobacter mediterraneus]MBM1655088.1 homocysteine S-methyltransferase family prote